MADSLSESRGDRRPEQGNAVTRTLLIAEPCPLSEAIARSCSAALDGISRLEFCPDRAALEQRLAALQPVVVIYLAATTTGRAPARDAAATVLDLVAGAHVERLIVVSSAAIEAPRAVHPGMVRERERPARGVDPAADRWADVEAAAVEARDRSGFTLTILRPAAMPAARTSDPLAQIVEGGVTLTVAGHDPPVQLLAPEDLGRALARVVEAGGEGIYHVAPAGVVPLHDAIRLAGGTRLPLPMWLLQGMRLLGRVGGGRPTEDLERLRYTATISGDRVERELGFIPQHSSAEVARAQRRDGRGPSPPAFDDFGQSPSYIKLLHTTLMRFLHDIYWRVDLAGVEHIPRSGPAVLTGVHRGFMPFDGSMALYGVARETGRLVRFLIHPSLVKMPFLADFIRRQGGVIACRDNADRVLRDDNLLGVFPEGIEGAFCSYRDAYRLRRDFGRDEFVKTALRNRAPIVPFVTVGSVEIFPVLAKIDWPWWQRISGWPCFPIAPPFPLAPIPLPSKWHTRFLEPINVHEMHPPEAANDRGIVEEIGNDVRRRMQQAIDGMLARRRHVFFGSLAKETTHEAD